MSLNKWQSKDLTRYVFRFHIVSEQKEMKRKLFDSNNTVQEQIQGAFKLVDSLTLTEICKFKELLREEHEVVHYHKQQKTGPNSDHS